MRSATFNQIMIGGYFKTTDGKWKVKASATTYYFVNDSIAKAYPMNLSQHVIAEESAIEK